MIGGQCARRMLGGLTARGWICFRSERRAPRRAGIRLAGPHSFLRPRRMLQALGSWQARQGEGGWAGSAVAAVRPTLPYYA